MRFRLALAVIAGALAICQTAAAAAQTWYYCDPARAITRSGDVFNAGSAVSPATALPQPSAAARSPRPPPHAASDDSAVGAGLKAPDFPAQGDALDDFCKTVTLPRTSALQRPRAARARHRAPEGFRRTRSRLSPAQQKALLADQNGWVKTYPQVCGLASDVPPPLPLAPAIKNCLAQAGRARVAYLKGARFVRGSAAYPGHNSAESNLGCRYHRESPPSPTRTPLGIPIEKRAILFEAPDVIEVLDKVVPFVRASGYRCNSVSSILPMFFYKRI